MFRTRSLLICAALVAIAAGLWPVAGRLYDERQRAQQIKSREAAVAQEIAATKLELAANKSRVLSEMKALQANGQHLDVMKLAGRYRLADDADLHAVYVASAAQVSAQQLIARMSQLVAANCTGIQAIQTAGTVLSALYPDVKQVSTAAWVAERVDALSVLAKIRGRIQDWINPASASIGKLGELTRDKLSAARGMHTPRLLPSIAQSVMTAPDPSALLCVWRVQGDWPNAGGASADAANTKGRFEMLIWYAPSATERTLEHDVLSLKI